MAIPHTTFNLRFKTKNLIPDDWTQMHSKLKFDNRAFFIPNPVAWYNVRFVSRNHNQSLENPQNHKFFLRKTKGTATNEQVLTKRIQFPVQSTLNWHTHTTLTR